MTMEMWRHGYAPLATVFAMRSAPGTLLAQSLLMAAPATVCGRVSGRLARQTMYNTWTLPLWPRWVGPWVAAAALECSTTTDSAIPQTAKLGCVVGDDTAAVVQSANWQGWPSSVPLHELQTPASVLVDSVAQALVELLEQRGHLYVCHALRRPAESL